MYYDYYNTVRGREREREEESREGSEEVTEVLFLRSDLSVLCLFSVWRLSVSCFLFAVRCSLLIVTDIWTLLWNIMFIHPMRESCSLSIFIIMFSVACEISPFTSTHFEPIRAAVLDSTHSMCQCEILGALLLLKLLVSDLW